MSRESKLRALASRLVLDLWYGSAPLPNDIAYRGDVPWDEDGSAMAAAQLADESPCLIARLGSSELACASYYTRWRRGRGVRLRCPRKLRRIMSVNAGMFPSDDASLDRFFEILLTAVAKTDVMGVWFNRNQRRSIQQFCPNATPVQLDALNPVLRENPRSAELASKTVLVVHPFARTIASQYRERLAKSFANPRVLPEFDLKTLVAIQSSAGSRCDHATRFETLEHMCQEIAAVDFDVAIIGAGEYGLPLASWMKDLGRKAVHLGCATQLLFGVKGRRWEVESPDDTVRFSMNTGSGPPQTRHLRMRSLSRMAATGE